MRTEFAYPLVICNSSGEVMKRRDVVWTIGGAIIIGILVNVPPVSDWIDNLSWIWIGAAAVVTVVLIVVMALIQKRTDKRTAQRD